MKLVRLAVALLLAGAASSQTPTVTGNVTQALTVLAYGNPSAQQTVPVGPLPATGAVLSANSNGGSASMQWVPTGGHPSGVAGFRVGASGVGMPSFFTAAGFDNDGEVVLQLVMPAPTPVLVVIQGAAQASSSSTSTQIDIDDDQTIDATLSASLFTPSATVSAEFGLLVGPSGRVIRILHSSSGIWSGLGGIPSVSSSLTLTFYANAYPISAYGPGCVPLTSTRDAVGAATFHCPASSTSLAAFAVGLNAMQVPVPISPGCFQLTDVVFSVLALPAGGQASYALPLPLLPPGFTVRTQAAVIEANLTVRTSNGLAIVGPS